MMIPISGTVVVIFAVIIFVMYLNEGRNAAQHRHRRKQSSDTLYGRERPEGRDDTQ